MSVLFKTSGLLTTVQDAGRYGKQAFGVSVSGAMDLRSLRTANILVNNTPDEAALEVTLVGPTIEFQENNVIAITGGNLSPSINGSSVPMYRAFAVRKGDVLSFGALVAGCRTYIAFAGGFRIPPYMGSKATYLPGKFGGLEGRKVQTGDVIEFSAPKETLPNMSARVIEQEDFSSSEIRLRVILGPQDDYFTKDGIETFFSESYLITNESDRMGTRLDGASVQHVKDGNIISDGVAFGSIQIPSNGKPIIMLADRQCTGGYTKIGAIASVDLPLLVQAKPGVRITFQKISIEQAQELYLTQRASLERHQAKWERATESPTQESHAFRISVGDRVYEVIVEEVI